MIFVRFHLFLTISIFSAAKRWYNCTLYVNLTLFKVGDLMSIRWAYCPCNHCFSFPLFYIRSNRVSLACILFDIINTIPIFYLKKKKRGRWYDWFVFVQSRWYSFPPTSDGWDFFFLGFICFLNNQTGDRCTRFVNFTLFDWIVLFPILGF